MRVNIIGFYQKDWAARDIEIRAAQSYHLQKIKWNKIKKSSFKFQNSFLSYEDSEIRKANIRIWIIKTNLRFSTK